MTHRVFSRNASSSRAIPVERLIRDVVDDPVYPSFWGRNQPGMQAAEEHDALITLNHLSPGVSRAEAWDHARESAIRFAGAYTAAGYHKQIVNRLLEPFCHINVVVTATEWENFFALRCHPDAQPEMRLLAEAMRDAMAASEPVLLKPGQWHLPYVNFDDVVWYHGDPTLKGTLTADEVFIVYKGWPAADLPWREDSPFIKLSVARCARVSYLTQEGKRPSVEEDLKLYDRLVGSVPIHASPAEHQATPDAKSLYDEGGWKNWKLHGNLRGWCQYRKVLETNHKE